MPRTLDQQDLVLLFDTIVNERVDSGFDQDGDPTLARMSGSLSFEEFKKSIVRVASLVSVQSQRIRMGPEEVMAEHDRLFDASGGEAPAEWDEHGNPIRYRTVVKLAKKPAPAQAALPDSTGAPPRLYDISKLKLENFHKVLHFVVSETRGKAPVYKQPNTTEFGMSSTGQSQLREQPQIED